MNWRHSGQRSRGGFALWLALVLAIAPFFDGGVAVAGNEPGGSGQRPVFSDGTSGPTGSVAAAAACQPFLGMLSRLTAVETIAGLPAKTPTSAPRPTYLLEPVSIAIGLERRFPSLLLSHQGSIGTARKPTGPPV